MRSLHGRSDVDQAGGVWASGQLHVSDQGMTDRELSLGVEGLRDAGPRRLAVLHVSSAADGR